MKERYDVAVIGAGTAGAAAAAFCAQAGLRAICFERGPLDRAGARWVNGVPRWAFDRVGIEQPRGAELRGADEPFHLVAGFGPERIVIHEHDVLEVDMRLLVQRLQRLARESGAELRGEVRIDGVGEGEVRYAEGSVVADHIVDASGLTGLRLLGGEWATGSDICAAAQAVHEVADRAGAAAYFEKNRTPLGEALCFSSIEGGFSILNVKSDGDEISILTGSVPAAGFVSGKQILEEFVQEHPWIGPRVFGGARALPIRRPYDRLSADRVHAIGDAASQVFPAHGSGIAPGMIAAHILAQAIAAGESYEIKAQRELGGLLASYDVFRRFSQTLGPDEVHQLMKLGLMDEESSRAALEMRFPPVVGLQDKLQALAASPRIALRLGNVVARMIAARALYSVYPGEAAAMPAWSAAARWAVS